MRGIKIAAILLASLAGNPHASAEGGRFLPSGESQPWVIEGVFASPRGELHFTSKEDGGRTAFLRVPSGAVVGLNEIRGPVACEEWMISKAGGRAPEGCEFIFWNPLEGTYLSVRSSEIEEGGLFQSVKGAIRGQNVAL